MTPYYTDVSVVMTTFNRPALLRNTLDSIARQNVNKLEIIIVDDGNDAETQKMCRAIEMHSSELPVRYFKLTRDRTKGYNNPARPNNVGVRQAKGDIIILQNAECKHGNTEVIAKLAERCGTNNAVFAQVESLHEHGGGSGWYIHPKHNPRPYFFCGALRRSWFEKLRGFDEDYQYYGFDDTDFADRLAAEGVQFDFTDIPVKHQWHPSSYDPNDPNNQIPALTYARKTMEMKAGKITTVRNLGREWGQL